MFNYRKFRKDHELFQKELAELMGLSQPGLSKYENELTEPNQTQYKSLCDKFGKSTIDSYYFDEDKSQSGPTNSGNLDSDVVQLLVSQNATIAKQIELFASLSKQLSDISNKLDTILGKN